MRIALFLVVCLAASPVFAQQIRTVQVPENMLTAEQKAQIEAENLKSRVEQYGNWVGFGAELGHAVDSSLGALTERADQFSKTGVGKFTLVLVAWRVIGEYFARIVIGLGLFLVLIPIWVWSFHRNVVERSVLLKVLPDKTREYKVVNKRDEFKHSSVADQKTCYMLWHWLILGLIVVLNSLLMFAG